MDVLPPRAAGALLAYLAALAARVPPDDRSVLVALVARGALAPALAAWAAGYPGKAWARLNGAWTEALLREELPYSPLPVLTWPAPP
ncbi:hypothetical protein tb265_00240 [Gemmatimonadetes bacterium T265]|nr:hypothetical protein tb265_00240 [Gemmatimonadetes bacterium T265]